jgi:hypothetical protein
MLFFIIRILPLLLPALYLGCLKGFFWVVTDWYWWVIASVVLNAVYFVLLYSKLKRKRIWFFAIYATVFTLVGYLYASLLSSPLVINLFLIAWALIYLIYLEGVFNYLYRTDRFFLLDLKSITAYINLAIFFIASFSLFNFYILFDWQLWQVLPAWVIVVFIILFNRFLSFAFPSKTNLIYSGAITVILLEILLGLIWWPTSIYVSSFVLLVAYYLLSSLGVLYFAGRLSKKVLWQYLILAAVVLTLVLATAQWL